MSGWIEVRADLAEIPADWSVFAEAFEHYGCPSSLQTDRPPSITGHLPNVAGVDAQVEALIARLTSLGAGSVLAKEIPDEDWSALWRHHFKTMRVGRNIVVRPSWESAELGPEDVEIVIEPGQAFGTGDHPTTRLCLELLEAELLRSVPGRLLDLGCGSGILAIGAQKLISASSLSFGSKGAGRGGGRSKEALPGSPTPTLPLASEGGGEPGLCEKPSPQFAALTVPLPMEEGRTVIAADIDPIAVEVAKENFALNSVEIDVFCSAGFEDERLDGPFDVIVSNIISATLIRSAVQASQRLVTDGRWIVSGIIEDNWPDVHAAAEQAGFFLLDERRESGWVAAVFSRPGAAHSPFRHDPFPPAAGP